MDSNAPVWPLELGIWTPTLWCGPLTWGYGLARFGVAPRLGDMDFRASVPPVELGIWTLMLWCGPWSWGYVLSYFGVAP